MKIGGLIKEALSYAIPRSVVVHGPRAPDCAAALTFDDGPHPEHTPHLLDILDQHGVKATFFLLGAEVRRHPALARSIHRRGHQVASHGFDHRNARAQAWRNVVDDVLLARDVLQEIIGAPLPQDFRPPYGAVSPVAFALLAQRGFRFVFWSLDSLDHSWSDPGQISERITNLMRAGDIVLFHEDYLHTLNALPIILSSLQSKEIRLTTVDEMTRVLNRSAGHARRDSS